MNCEQVRENIYDYLDDALSPSRKAALEKHLAECLLCREAVRRETQLAQSLSTGLEQAVEAVSLDPTTRRGIARALERSIAEPRARPLALLWSRLALPLAAAVLLLVAIWMGHHFVGGENSPLEMAHIAVPAADHRALVYLSYSVPAYTFQKEGDWVIDALTSDKLVADGVHQ
jgi:predicted anti-sigma-YlaC factor YlaD